MTVDPRVPRGAPLTDREDERGALEALLAAVQAGESRALVLRGDAGVGKSALLEHLVDSARGCRVVRASGVQSEMELAFAGLHQLCVPVGHRIDRLPPPQRGALRTVLGLGEGPPPDRFLVGLAVLTLLADLAGERPLVCVVDDEQWLDAASAQALGFAARRLAADRVGLVFAARVPSGNLAGLPELRVDGLRLEHARELLASALPVPLDERVRELVVAEAQGNPLALLELPRMLTPAGIAGGFGLPAAVPLPGRIEEGFRRRLEALPPPSQLLLQLAAADPSGDPGLVRRAADRLGVPARATEPAVDAGLVALGAQVRFRHPLVRSAAYRSASAATRREVHRALAAATDATADPDRRAWHAAQAADGPDEDVAAELERSAHRAQARGGVAAAAAFLERSVRLTADPARYPERVLAAAAATLSAGAFDRAHELLAALGTEPLDDRRAALADLLRARLAFVGGMGGDAPPLLLAAARRLERTDPALARTTLLEAWTAASFAGRIRGPGSMEAVADAVRALPPPEHPRPVDLLLDALALLSAEGRAAAAPALRRVAARFAAGDLAREDGLRHGWAAAALVRDEDAALAIQSREARLAREAGALDALPLALVALAMSRVWRGDLAAADACIAETDAVREITGSPIAPYPAMLVAALRGDPAELAPLTGAARAEAEAGGQRAAATYADWVDAILDNARGRTADAFAAARRAVADEHVFVSLWALPELVEAAAGAGELRAAEQALDQLAESVGPDGTDLGLGLVARSRALLTGSAAAEALHREAVERLERAGARPDLARAHLVHGERLRRDGRHPEARARLRSAHALFDGMGLAAFADRAARELAALGEEVTPRSSPPRAAGALTQKEALIARLAAEGATNAEIGAQLYLSARTVEWHLRKVFTKLDVSSRRDLRRALAGPP